MLLLLLPTRPCIAHVIFTCAIRDLEGNNNNSIANCLYYLLRKSNQPEDGS